MEFIFIKNIQFTQLIKANGRLREFNFWKHRAPDGGDVFSVNVIDDRDQRIQFQLQKDNDEWTPIGKSLPDWILERNREMADAVETALRAHQNAIQSRKPQQD